MKQWLDEKGKLFGLINPIDLAVILVIFSLGIKVLSDFRPAPLKLRQNPIAVGILVKNVPPYVVQSLAIKEDFYQDRTNAYLGKIVSIKTAPAEIILKNGGKLVLSTSPRHFDLRLELKRTGEIFTGESKHGVYLGKLPVKVGDRLSGHTLYTSLKGEVEYLRIGKSQR